MSAPSSSLQLPTKMSICGSTQVDVVQWSYQYWGLTGHNTNNWLGPNDTVQKDVSDQDKGPRAKDNYVI